MRRADQYLVERGYYESRARAQSAIRAGCVAVNGKVLTKPSAKITPGSQIEARLEHPYVSRGGLKLTRALEVFGVFPKGRVCLDIGASTGGFTDVLLKAGAAKIYAVDVGHDQLHESLRANSRVISMEGRDIRKLTARDLNPMPDLAVCDVSFISLTKALPPILALLPLGAELVTLIKPQFEVGRENIGKGGLVRSPNLGWAATAQLTAWFEDVGWPVRGQAASPIKGGDGNAEFLLYAVKA